MSSAFARPAPSPKSAPVRRRSAEATRERILDAAEELFALSGFHGTSMRDVAERSKHRLALITYHFKTKEDLFSRVVERRASYMGMQRINALDAARQRARGSAVPVRDLICGYVWPFIERSLHGDQGWKNYSQLVARLANSPSWAAIISTYYDAVARQYLIEFRRSLSDVPEPTVYHAFSFMVGTMLATVAEPGRIANLSGGTIAESDLEGAFKVMVPFLEAGFLTLQPSAIAAGQARQAVL